MPCLRRLPTISRPRSTLFAAAPRSSRPKISQLSKADWQKPSQRSSGVGQPMASAEQYLLNDAIADYRIEWGDTRSSADTIAARLKHVSDFLEAEESAGGVFGLETSCAVACGTPFVTAFRAWSRKQPVTWRNKAGQVTASRPRSAATTEESVLQLAAALNHAVDADPPRSERRPVYRPLPRKQVSRPRRHRVDVATLAAMLGYAAEPEKRRGSLHAFLVASICTITRPDAVVNICVAPEREQWFPGSPTLDLNPFGRAQTKKYGHCCRCCRSWQHGWQPSSRLISASTPPIAQARATW